MQHYDYHKRIPCKLRLMTVKCMTTVNVSAPLNLNIAIIIRPNDQ